jgi:hypothetical protein
MRHTTTFLRPPPVVDAPYLPYPIRVVLAPRRPPVTVMLPLLLIPPTVLQRTLKTIRKTVAAIPYLCGLPVRRPFAPASWARPPPKAA